MKKFFSFFIKHGLKKYIYGDSSSYYETMNSAIEEMNNNPTLGFFGFN